MRAAGVAWLANPRDLKERVMGVPFKGKINVDIRDSVPTAPFAFIGVDLEREAAAMPARE
jgi:hypothetical protein